MEKGISVFVFFWCWQLLELMQGFIVSNIANEEMEMNKSYSVGVRLVSRNFSCHAYFLPKQSIAICVMYDASCYVWMLLIFFCFVWVHDLDLYLPSQFVDWIVE